MGAKILLGFGAASEQKALRLNRKVLLYSGFGSPDGISVLVRR